MAGSGVCKETDSELKFSLCVSVRDGGYERLRLEDSGHRGDREWGVQVEQSAISFAARGRILVLGTASADVGEESYFRSVTKLSE